MKELRLIYKTARQIAQEKEKARRAALQNNPDVTSTPGYDNIVRGGETENSYATPSTFDRYSTRGAEANAARQRAERAKSLLAGGQPPTTVANQQNVRNTLLDQAGQQYNQVNYQAGAMGQAGATGDTTKSRQSMGEIERSARERLTQAGYSGQELEDQYQKSKAAAQQTMSTTGLSIDQGGSLRSLRQQQQQQQQSDFSNIVGYTTVKIPVYNENGNIVNYRTESRVDPAETARLRQQAEDRFAKQNIAFEESKQAKKDTALDLQQMADQTKFDTTTIDQTSSVIDNILNQLDGLDPDLKAVYLPELLAQQSRALTIQQTAKDIIADQPSRKEIEEGYDDDKERVLDNEKKWQDLLDKSKETQLEAAEYARDMLETDEKIRKIRAAESEQAMLKTNIQNERRVRRTLGKLGIETDLQGINFLTETITEGQQALANLRQVNDLTTLKANLAIGEGYRLDVANIMNQYESKYLQITTEADEKLDAIKNAINLDTNERDKKIEETMRWQALELDKIDMESGKSVKEARLFAMNQKDKKAQEARQAEEDALEKIDYLLSNYPRESVAEAIKELGKNVTSFNVQALIDNPTFDEIDKAKKAVSSRTLGVSSYTNALLPSTLIPQPEVSLDDYMQEKIMEIEEGKMMSLDVEERAIILEENKEKWEKEYEAVYMLGASVISSENAIQSLKLQFGDGAITAAQLVIDGTYGGTNAIKNAAKAQGVPESVVATAVTTLRQSGVVPETVVLSAGLQKGWDTLRKEIEKDTFYSVYKGATSAVSRIKTAIGENGGADGLSDIMAINSFQNGIVDPGATVREGDVTLIQTAIAWADLVNLRYWKGKISDGDKLPAEMRAKMLELASNTEKAYKADFETITLPKFQQEVRQKGLPSSVLDQYSGYKGGTYVSDEVSNFIDSLGY